MIVYTDMVADLFHSGHVNLLKNIKNKYPNSTLLVGIHSDNDVFSYKRETIINMDNRIDVVSSCKYVDKVIPNAPLFICENFIKKYNIDKIIHAHHISEHIKYFKMYEIPINLNIFERFEYTEGISTTYIINKIIKLYS
jgi:cytidyltransferase-like protein